MIKITFPRLNFLVISLCFLLLISLFVSEPAYSRGGGGGGGCFAEGTLILTPEGNKKIQQLSPGDRLINYSFSTYSQERGTISKIEIINSPDYYLINDRTKVTGTHPFYVKTNEGIKLTQVRDLRQGDRLIERDNSLITIDSIEHIFKSISVYNLIAIEPNHNFYADGLLVHNKGGGGGGGGYGGGGSGQNPTITEKNFLGFLQASVILISGLSCILFWEQIYNFLVYSSQKFTEDSELIKFAEEINPNFKNKYSIWYSKDDQLWQQVSPQAELSKSEYRNFIGRTELLEQVENLFIQYQQDWTNKDFESMRRYVEEPFYTTQKKIFYRNYGSNFDIIYDCCLSSIVPIDIELESDKCFLRLQINGEMINFKLAPEGYILSGQADRRSFSEYWDIKLNPDKQCYLVNIKQVIQ